MFNRKPPIMKKFFSTFFILLIISTTLYSQSASADNEPAAKIKFNRVVYDYGTISQGSDGTCEFKFTNEGNAPLVLSYVRSSCGCTVPEWPKAPINKGEESKIKVKYNTRIKGNFNKSIIVYSNGSKDPMVLRIKGSVVEDDS